jgi:hypothetical protein
MAPTVHPFRFDRADDRGEVRHAVLSPADPPAADLGHAQLTLLFEVGHLRLQAFQA